MQINYDTKTDLLYIQLDEQKQEVVSKRHSDGVVLEIGVGNRILGIQISNASKHLNLESILPVKYNVSS
ncbi:MAG TPA: DUF2283 domain-containing protein [Candidatus Binatia bacterium]|jgi:uncharacterized protein YuzE|nr:DUF2283 domain-containing protein [Candidatus Binatia bacterium]